MAIFRTRDKFFLRKIITVVVLTAITLLVNTRYPSFALWCLYLMLVMFCCGGLVPLFLTHLKSDPTSLQGWAGWEKFNLNWSDVVYARCEQPKPRKSWLVLATGEKKYELPLELLDAQAVWQEVQRRVPPDALTAEAAERLAQVLEAVPARQVKV